MLTDCQTTTSERNDSFLAMASDFLTKTNTSLLCCQSVAVVVIHIRWVVISAVKLNYLRTSATLEVPTRCFYGKIKSF